MPLAFRFLTAAVFLILAAPHAASGQTAVSPIPFGMTHRIDIQFRVVDVPPDELAQAEQRATASPVMADALADKLQMGLAGPELDRLQGELLKIHPNLLSRSPVVLTALDNIPVPYSVVNTTIVSTGRTVTTTTATVVLARLISATTVGVELEGLTPHASSVPVFVVANGRPSVMALPSRPGEPVQLVFLTATVETGLVPLPPEVRTKNRPTPGGMNAYPTPGTDPNSIDQMQIGVPRVSDPMSILPAQGVKPIISISGK